MYSLIESYMSCLLTMQEWTEKWMLYFHPEKSKYMRIGRSDTEVHEDYSLRYVIPKSIPEKDIRVFIDNNLLFSQLLSNKIDMANKLLGLIRRTFIPLGADIFKGIYAAIIKPHLEFANHNRCRYLVKNIEARKRSETDCKISIWSAKSASWGHCHSEEHAKIWEWPSVFSAMFMT